MSDKTNRVEKGQRLDNKATAERLGRSESWLNHERAAGRGPRYCRIGKRCFYFESDLDEYEASRMVETADSRSTLTMSSTRSASRKQAAG